MPPPDRTTAMIPTSEHGHDRFDLFGLPPFDPSEVATPSRLWGRIQATLRADADHLVTDIRYVPRGFLAVGRCVECGGRVEGLADLASTADPEDRRQRATEVGILRPDFERGEALLAEVTDRVTKRLQAEHEACDESPRVHRLRPMTVQFLRDTVKGARARFAHDGEVPGTLHLLLEDGRGCTLPTDQIIRGAPVQSNERTVNRAAAVSALRAFFRARDLRPVAAVLVSEAWLTENDESEGPNEGSRSGEDREEVMTVSLVTPDVGYLAYAPIVRAGSVPKERRGQFDELTWRPITRPAPLTDGLFVGSDHELDRPEDVDRRRGIVLNTHSRN